MKKLIILALSLMLLVSCGEKEAPSESLEPAPSESISEEVKPSEEAEPSEEAPVEKDMTPANLKVYFLEEGDTSYVGTLSIADAENDPYIVNFILEADNTIENMELADASMDGEMTYSKGNIVSTYPSLKKGEKLLISTSFPGDMPSQCISYTDADGKVKTHLLYLSGMDGSVVLEEIKE